MKIHCAADHAGFKLKQKLIDHLSKQGHNVVDHGAFYYDALDGYPPQCIECAEAVLRDQGSRGIVIGGSGNGEQMAANLVPGIRAALIWSEETAKLARQHNDAQVASIGARMHREEDALRFIDIFITEPFSGEERHQKRINLMNQYQPQ